MRRRLLTLVFSTTLLALTILGVVLMTVIWTAMSSALQAPRPVEEEVRLTADHGRISPLAILSL